MNEPGVRREIDLGQKDEDVECLSGVLEGVKWISICI